MAPAESLGAAVHRALDRIDLRDDASAVPVKAAAKLAERGDDKPYDINNMSVVIAVCVTCVCPLFFHH